MEVSFEMNRPFDRQLLIAVILCAQLRATAAVAVESEPVVYSLSGLALLGSGRDLFNVGVGSFDVAREQGHKSGGRTSAATQLEYRLGQKLDFAGPLVGFVANEDRAVFGYGGFYFDVAIERLRRWRLSPILTLGVYDPGDSKRLGGVFEFHVGGTLTYELENSTRLGLTVTHISNAFIHEHNPGAELVMLTYMAPLDWGRFWSRGGRLEEPSHLALQRR